VSLAVPTLRRDHRVPFGLWIVATIASAALLVVSIVGWGHGGTATLRAMAASESMPDDQARAVAENTVLVWDRERNARHLANLEEMSCPDPRPDSIVAREIDDVRKGLPEVKDLHIVAFGSFSRNGSVWLLSVFYNEPGLVFELHIIDGALRVCEMGSAPVP
jgi:hypothetical protein